LRHDWRKLSFYAARYMSLVGIVGTAITPWLGEWATVAVAGAIVKGIRGQLDSSEMERVLKQAITAAEEAQPETGGLFFRCHRDGRNGVKKFLEQFFQSGEVLKELQKPLQDSWKPDVDILVVAFERSAKDHPEAKNYLANSLLLWMQTFVESYFAQVKGICFQVAKGQYLNQLAQRVDDVKFVGIAVPGEEVEKQEVLAQIFVMPDVREEKSRNLWNFSAFDSDSINLSYVIPLDEEVEKQWNMLNEQESLLTEQKQWAQRDRSTPRIPAPKILNLSQKKAVVLGAPGSGKTMLVSYFALMLCETQQSDPTQIGLEQDDDYLPVVVRIRDWILQPKMGLLEYLEYYAKTNLCTKELPTGFFEHWLERGRALILLDGLDEVVDEAQRRKVAEQIETFLHRYQSNPAVITSRPAGYRWDFFNLDEFPHYTLESFDDKQVAIFIDYWYDSRLKDDTAQAARRKADLQSAFARNERIRLLAKNPLLLTIITLIHRYGGELPKQRYELYEAAVKTLLVKWDSGKEIKRYEQDLVYLKQDDLLYILKKLAYWIHTKGSAGETEGGTLVKKNELIGQLRKEIQSRKKCEFDEAEEEAKRFIDFIQQRTGLLNEQGRDRYAFVHKTFQEYLTAEEIYYLANREDDTNIILDHFRAHLHDQHWREVLLLLVSRLEGHKARKAIQTILDTKSEFEQWLHRDLLFAGWCLTEDPADLKDVAEDLVGEILDRLVWLEVDTSDRVGSKIRDEVEKILRCFGETSSQQMLLEKLQAYGGRIYRSRLLKFQVAVGQQAEEEIIDTLLSFLVDGQSYDVWLDTLDILCDVQTTSDKVVNRLLSLQYWLFDIASPVFRRVVPIVWGDLGNVNAKLVTGLLSLIVNEKSNIRANAAEALGCLRNPSAEVLSGLLSLLGDQDSNVRAEASFALGRFRNPSAEVVSSLLFLLDDPKEYVRANASSALGQLGNNSAEVVSSLLFLLDDPKEYVRANASSALGQLGNNSAEVLSSLLSLLDDPKEDVRANASSALGQLGNNSAEVLSSLLSLLEDQDSKVRAIASSALGQLGNSSKEVVSCLFFSLGDTRFNVRASVAKSLRQLAKTSDAIRPEVVQWLEQNPNDDGIGNAINCLWSIVVE
jgi:HEAT repeat protein